MAKKETKIEITDNTEPTEHTLETDGDIGHGDDAPDESTTPDLESDHSPQSDQESDEGSGLYKDTDKEQDPESDGDQDELQAARKDAKDAYDRFLRVSAEFDNYKKRAIREAAEFKKYANETLVREILPIIDNLERAIESSDADSEAQNSLVEGVDMTLKEMLKVFDKFHVKPIDAIGESFDPCYHQAVIQEESDGHPDNTVIKELQKGYMMHDRLIRPAMVVVSSSKPGNGLGADGSCEEKIEE